MAGWNITKSARFVAHLSAGLAPKAAAEAAGYSPSRTREADEMAARPEIVARVTKLQWEKARETADLAPVIKALMDAAAEARTLQNAAAFAEARALLVEAARLKSLPQPPSAPPAPRQPEMTEEEWLAAYAADGERLP